MRSHGVACGVLLVTVAALLAGLVTPAAATVRIKGNVKIYNEYSKVYEPLQYARVRAVLWEDFDGDTLDPEGETDANGDWSVSKGNAWWYDGYHCYVIVFAESSGRLEIQSIYMQIDGYQAFSAETVAHDDATKVIDLKIGGPQQNIASWHVGGTAAFGDYDSASATRGVRAFTIYNEMIRHRMWLQNAAFRSTDFEEKEVSYPAGDGAAYRRVLDYIRIPDSEFEGKTKPEDWLDSFHTFRHELSHGVMADEFWELPTGAGEHGYLEECDHHEGAWCEGWADFLPEPSLEADYGVTWQDVETSPDLAYPIAASPSHSRIEHHISSALYDIFDPCGWEKRGNQVPELPGDEMFWDGLEDPRLEMIRTVFRGDHPWTFTRGMGDNDPDAFVRFWLGRDSLAPFKHELKAIVLNRGIRSPHFTQTPPTMLVGTPTWDKCTVRIPFTVSENDPEDRGKVWAELYGPAGLVQRKLLSDGWDGSVVQGSFEQGVAWQPGFPQPVFHVAANDDMNSRFSTLNLDVPAGSQAGGLVVKVLSLEARRRFTGTGVPEGYWPPNAPALTSVWAKITVDDGKLAAPRVTPLVNTGQVTVTGQTRDILKPDGWTGEKGEAYKQQTLGDYLEVRLEGGFRIGSGGQTNVPQQKIRCTREELYGIGTHTKKVITHVTTIAVPSGGQSVQASFVNELVITYQISPQRPPAATPTPPTVPITQPSVALSGLSFAVPNLEGASTAAPLASVQVLTLSRLLSKSSQLVDEYARLQGVVREVEQELEYRLGPRQTPPAAGAAQPGQATLQSSVVTAQQLAQGALQVKPRELKPGAFLQRAAAGQTQLAVLTAEQRAHVQGLSATLKLAEDRLPQIEAQSATLRQQLAAGLAKMTAKPGVPAADLANVKLAIGRVDAGLAAVSGNLPKTRTVVTLERQVLGRVPR